MRSITDVIRHFKQNWMRELCPEAIERACRDHGMTWRQSTLNPIVTVQVFFLQVLHGNTACTLASSVEPRLHGSRLLQSKDAIEARCFEDVIAAIGRTTSGQRHR